MLKKGTFEIRSFTDYSNTFTISYIADRKCDWEVFVMV